MIRFVIGLILVMSGAEVIDYTLTDILLTSFGLFLILWSGYSYKNKSIQYRHCKNIRRRYS